MERLSSAAFSLVVHVGILSCGVGWNRQEKRDSSGEEVSAVPGHVHHLGLLQHAGAGAGAVAGLSTALPERVISPSAGLSQHSTFHTSSGSRSNSAPALSEH